MSIIAFIALVASFSLKNLPISEKMFVPLSLSMGFCTLLQIVTGTGVWV
jgi:predicted histidine transporter YuiF (NhaC family)